MKKSKAENKVSKIVIEEECLSIHNVGAYKDKICESLQKGKVPQVSIKHVKEMDVTGIQLLVSLHNTFRNKKGTVEWKLPKELKERMSGYGFTIFS